MTCDGCGSTEARMIQYSYGKGHVLKQCDKCSEIRPSGTPDVYFKEPYTDHNLSSEAHPGPKEITSRADKKYWLNKCNLREAGDRVHGASSFDPISHRHAEESLRRKSR